VPETAVRSLSFYYSLKMFLSGHGYSPLQLQVYREFRTFVSGIRPGYNAPPLVLIKSSLAFSIRYSYKYTPIVFWAPKKQDRQGKC
jgi:hypothetical protein